MSRALFVFPVFAEDVPRVIHVEGAVSLTHEVPVRDVMYISGAADDLEAAERTMAQVRLRVKGAVTVDSHTVSVAPDLATFAASVTEHAERNRPLFRAVVAARHALGLQTYDVARDVTAALWAAAKGAPLDAVAIERLSQRIAFDVEMIDPDRWRAFEQLRALGVLDAALRAPPAELILAALGARADVWWRDPALPAKVDESSDREAVRAENRWLSVVAWALGRLDTVDAVAVDVLACALRSIPMPPEPAPALAPKLAAPMLAVPSPQESRTVPPKSKMLPRKALPRVAPSNPPRVITSPVGSSKLRLIETAGGMHPRYRVEIDGEARRVRSRLTYEDLHGGPDEVLDWIEEDDADLDVLVGCLGDAKTKRIETAGGLRLEYEVLGQYPEIDRRAVTIEVGSTGPVSIDMRWLWVAGSFY